MDIFFLELCKYISLTRSSLIILFLALHDWIDIYPFNDLATFNKHCSLRNKIVMTIINSPFYVIYTAILLYFWSTPMPFYAQTYLLMCNLLFLIGIMFSWWLPYFFAWPYFALRATKDRPASQVEDLHKNHGTTHTFLPTIGNNPIPDTLHVIFHLIFVINMITTLTIIYS